MSALTDPPAERVGERIERLALVLSDLGIPRMPARVFSALVFADEDALGAAELGERLGASAGSISSAVRYLEHSGLAIRKRRPGERRDLYAMHALDYTAMFQRRRQLQAWYDVVEEDLELVGEDSRAAARLRDMHSLLEFLIGEMDAGTERWEQWQREH